MNIQLNELIAEPLAEVIDWESDIWGRCFDLEPGARYQLDAPSGNGKTSLIHILSGVRNDYRGGCMIDGREAVSLSLREWCELRRCRLAVMFQDLRLFPDLTVFENIELKSCLTDIELSPAPMAMLKQLGLGDFQGRFVKTLSWGECQRVALVRALSQPFELILLDEPFSHLDSANIESACRLIEQACRERGAGMIMTSLGYEYPLAIDHRVNL